MKGALFAVLALCGSPLAAQSRVLDAFETATAWSAVPGEGVDLTLATGPGMRGKALRLDFDFHGRGGYAVAHRDLPVDLPENYALSFWIRDPEIGQGAV